MPLNITITKENLQNGVVENVKRQIEDLTHSPAAIRSFENSVIFNFEMNFEDLLHSLASVEVKKWFKKLDSEVPYIPYFLSDGSDYTLTYYLMGIIDFNEKGKEVSFSPNQAKSFFKEKARDIQNLCLPNNINPQHAIDRLSSFLGGVSESDMEKRDVINTFVQKDKVAKIKSKFENMLDKYGSFSSIAGENRVRLFVVFEKKSTEISFSSISFYPDKEEIPYFEVVFKIDGTDIVFPVVAMYDSDTLVSSLEKWNGAFIEAFIKENESYSKLFVIEQPIKPNIVFDEAVVSETEVADQKNLKIIELEKKLSVLEGEIRKKDSMIDYYETELSKKKKGFFGKLFG